MGGAAARRFSGLDQSLGIASGENPKQTWTDEEFAERRGDEPA
jgi:hypothetical protein